jgi:hypothetical protein
LGALRALYLREKSEEGSNVMLTQKRPRKSLSAEMTHLNELLDEALKETFPASDPVAIDVELRPPENGVAGKPGASAKSMRKKRRACNTRKRSSRR